MNLVLHASQHEFLFEHDRVKLVLGTHDHVEQWNEDSKGTDDHSDQKQCLRLQLVLGLAEDEQFEQDVDSQLGRVLRKEWNDAHQLAKHQGLSHEVERIVNAEWVKNGC